MNENLWLGWDTFGTVWNVFGMLVNVIIVL